MPESRGRRRWTGGLSFNATPLVDVIFILAIFFMLVSRFSSEEQIPMELPQPAQSRARAARMPERVLINCRPADRTRPADGALYSVGPNRPEPLHVIADRLTRMKRSTPELKVVIRADRRLPYADVRDVMRVVAGLNIDMLNVVAHVGDEQ